MAVIKIKPIKSTLKKALEYIQNPDKTDDKMLVSSFGCSYETADIEFAFTLSQALDKGNNLGHDRFFYRCKSFLSSNYKLTKGKADWLIGINATRLFSCLYRHTFECGSCTETNLKNAGR